MCETDSDTTPTKRTVYLRKSSRSGRMKLVKEGPDAGIVLQGRTSSDESSGGSNRIRCKLVLCCKSATKVRNNGKKKDKCTCGQNCDGDPCDEKWSFRCDIKDDKRKKNKNKGFLHFKVRSEACCHCNGSENDGWLCDVCRAEEKKKGILKFVARDCDSDSGSEHYDDRDEDSDECVDNYDDGHFAKKCDEWMKAAAKKRKNERKQAAVCNCHRPGCNVCVIVNC